MIYIAAPYSHPNQEVRERLVEAVASYAYDLIAKGKLAFSPVLHCVEIERKLDVPGDYTFWQNYCLGMLRRSSEVHVLMLTGWEYSKGVQAETDAAFELKLPLHYIKL